MEQDEDVKPVIAAPTPRPQPAKDLITLINRKNGEPYRFACKTCIDGHRAPLCDPKKHRGKILFRRPAPGRPSRNCGHPTARGCDCKTNRQLCCVLTEAEWDRVERQETPVVNMYDNKEDLEKAYEQREAPLETYATPYQARNGLESYPTPSPHSGFVQPASTHMNSSPFSDGTPSLPHGSLSSSFHGNTAPQGPTYENTRPQGHAAPGADPRSWSGQPGPNPPMPPFELRETPYSLPFNPRISAPSHSHTNFGTMEPQQLLPQQPVQGTVHQYMDQRSMCPGSGPPMGMHPQGMSSGPLSPMGMHPQGMRSDPMSPFEMHPQGMSSGPLSPPAGVSLAAQFRSWSPASNLDRSDYLTGSAVPMGYFGNYNSPSPAPAQQFPCSRCASSQCTCTNCPEVIQDYGNRGAWSRQCGRNGHLDDTPSFFVPQSLTSLPMQTQAMCNTPQQTVHVPAARTGCCSDAGNGPSIGMLNSGGAYGYTPRSSGELTEDSTANHPRMDSSVQFPPQQQMDSSMADLPSNSIQVSHSQMESLTGEPILGTSPLVFPSPNESDMIDFGEFGEFVTLDPPMSDEQGPPPDQS